jgi:hypothetical protein
MRHVNKVLLLLIVLVAVPLLYFAAHMSSMTVVVRTKGLTYESVRPQEYMVFGPEYRFGGLMSELFFLPANWLDRKIRPGFWQITYEVEDLQSAPPVAPNTTSNTMDGGGKNWHDRAAKAEPDFR